MITHSKNPQSVRADGNRIAQMMTQPPVTAAPDCSVGKVIDLMLANDISTLLIVDESKRLIGLVTESSLLAAAFDPMLQSDPISLHMQRRFASLDSRASLDAAVEAFLLHRVRHLPVLENGIPIGVLNRRALLRSLVQNKA